MTNRRPTSAPRNLAVLAVSLTALISQTGCEQLRTQLRAAAIPAAEIVVSDLVSQFIDDLFPDPSTETP